MIARFELSQRFEIVERERERETENINQIRVDG